MKQKKRPEQCLPGNSKKQKKSLQAEERKPSPSGFFPAGFRKVLFRPFVKQKGSLTIEAAVAVPVFLVTISMLLGILDLYRIQTLVKTSLNESGMELGMYTYSANKEETGISSAFCAAYAAGKMPDLGKQVKISLLGSGIQNSYVELKAEIRYKLPIALFPLPTIRLENTAYVRCWVGGRDEGGPAGIKMRQEEMVYVTEYESVYHTSGTCTHMELAIHQGKRDEVKNMRNQYGKKYHVCEKCGNGRNEEGNVYYTEKGDCFHVSASCSGLKRTVRLVKKSELHHLSQCSRCSDREQP